MSLLFQNQTKMKDEEKEKISRSDGTFIQKGKQKQMKTFIFRIQHRNIFLFKRIKKKTFTISVEDCFNFKLRG